MPPTKLSIQTKEMFSQDSAFRDGNPVFEIHQLADLEHETVIISATGPKLSVSFWMERTRSHSGASAAVSENKKVRSQGTRVADFTGQTRWLPAWTPSLWFHAWPVGRFLPPPGRWPPTPLGLPPAPAAASPSPPAASSSPAGWCGGGFQHPEHHPPRSPLWWFDPCWQRDRSITLPLTPGSCSTLWDLNGW